MKIMTRCISTRSQKNRTKPKIIEKTQRKSSKKMDEERLNKKLKRTKKR